MSFTSSSPIGLPAEALPWTTNTRPSAGRTGAGPGSARWRGPSSDGHSSNPCWRRTTRGRVAERADTEATAVRAVVRGEVQGIGYRDATQRRARQLGVMGWVRNEDDGSVL